jgi:hypothetical protein
MNTAEDDRPLLPPEGDPRDGMGAVIWLALAFALALMGAMALPVLLRAR